MTERSVYERDHAANMAKLRQLADDADESKAKMKDQGDEEAAQYYAGRRDGILRAISVISGGG